MRRALQLASLGAGYASPNPMVGAVIVADGRIIGEGWHHRCGQPHAEVNAVNSVAESDRHLLKDSTIYVTLEPCAHYGKTPPCALLLIEHNIPRIVVATVDPFSKVAGKGIQMLTDAGRQVSVGLLEKEARRLNRRFFTAHTLRRPHILLKWAKSADNKIARVCDNGTSQSVALSNPVSKIFMHRQRALADAILVGTGTIICDNPMLNCRLWSGTDPRRVYFKSNHIPTDSNILKTTDKASETIVLDPQLPLAENMHLLYEKYNITSIMVEGGSRLLQSFINADLYDEIRIETSPIEIRNGIDAPIPPLNSLTLTDTEIIGKNIIQTFTKKD